MKMHVQTIITPVREFSQCLRQILDERKISASELARMMAYKSRNSIFRILDGIGGQSARQAFYDRLIGEDPLGLSSEERAALEQAMEVSRVGRHAFMSNHEMREMLMNKDEAADKRTVCLDMPPEGKDYGFRQALEEITRARQAHIVILGCCYKEIFEAIREQIYTVNMAGKVKVRHLIYTGEEEIVHNIAAIQPLLYCDLYTAHCVEPGLLSKEREQFYRQNSIYILMQDNSGEWYVQTLILVDKGVFVPLSRVRMAENDRLRCYFEADLKKLPLLKTDIPGSGRLESYLNYTQSCRKLEANRTIYMIKPDIPLSCVHPDILFPCVKEEFWQMAGEQAETVKSELRQIHLARWENLFDSRKICHMILSQEAMRQFAATGRQSDHFFALRTYAKEDRVQILGHLREKIGEDIGFKLYFFKENFESPVMEIGLYEGVGTLMTKPYTHYDLAGDHAEAIITQREFCERYKDFYIKDLLERHVISQEETLEVMDELIRIAENA